MDNDEQNFDLEKSISQKPGDIFSDVVSIFQSNGIRFSFQDDNGLDRFLLDYGRYFLLRIGILSFIIYVFQKLI